MVEGDCHPIFTQDPARWMQYMYRKVRVVTTAQQEHVGHVYTVDPVTGSFVLVQSPTLADSSDTVAAFNATTTTTTTGSICSSDTIADTTTTTTTTTDTTTTTTMDTDSSSVTATTTTTTATAITANPITTTISAAFKANMEVCVIPGHAVAEVVVLPEKDKEKEEEGIKKEDDVINDDDDHGARQQGDSISSSSCSSSSSTSEHRVKVKAMLDSLFLKTPCQTEWNGNTTTTTTTMGHLSAEALEERKERLKDWLLKNRLPVEEEEEDCDDSGGGGLCVAGAVSIQPPYSAADCFGTNEIILSRIQKLVKNMPTSV